MIQLVESPQECRSRSPKQYLALRYGSLSMVLALLAASGLCACKTTQPAAGLPKPFSLPYQRATTVPLQGAGTVQATLTEVQDSRCPTGVNCIVAGTAGVTVELRDKSDAQLVQLGYERNHSRDSQEVILNQRSYWLRLVEVTPYPSTSTEGQPKVATLRLRLR